QQLMIKGINAKYLVPIHGEYKMLRTLERNAMDVGYDKDHIFIIKNGDVLELNNHVLSYSTTRHPYSPIFINGQEVNTKTSELLNERNILSTEGVVNIVIAYNKSMLHISLTTRGCFYAKDCPQLSYKLSYSIKTELTKIINDNTYDNITELENLLKDKAKDVCQQII
ncbi:ribonuclease J, partial [bacterium]|nr:ribonuclease J [bacterium]